MMVQHDIGLARRELTVQQADLPTPLAGRDSGRGLRDGAGACGAKIVRMNSPIRDFGRAMLIGWLPRRPRSRPAHSARNQDRTTSTLVSLSPPDRSRSCTPAMRDGFRCFFPFEEDE